MVAVELLLSKLTAHGVCEKMNWQRLPAIIETYMVCCPALDLNLRFLPRAGGYYDQYHVDMQGFRVIERAIIIHTNREAEQARHG